MDSRDKRGGPGSCEHVGDEGGVAVAEHPHLDALLLDPLHERHTKFACKLMAWHTMWSAGGSVHEHFDWERHVTSCKLQTEFKLEQDRFQMWLKQGSQMFLGMAT